MARDSHVRHIEMAAAVRRVQCSLTRLPSLGVRALRQQRAVRDVACKHVQQRGRRWCSASAGGGRLGLLSVVEEEIALEQELAQDLPEVTGFTTIITGCLATLQRESDGERVTVELDTHHAVEVMPGEEEEEEEPFFVPAFTITITNSQGSQLQMECSFDEHGEYLEQGKEWDNFTVNSVSVVAGNSPSPNTPYTVPADNLSDDLHDSILEYLQTRGINQTFTHDVFQFYKVHEHKCYLEYGLKALQNFLRST